MQGRPSSTHGTSSSRTLLAELEKARQENEQLRGKQDTAAVKLELHKNSEAQMQQAMAMQAKIERLFRAASAVDVAFIVDITGSMDSWIAAVKDQVTAMAMDWQKRLNTSMRAAFVGYRDYGEKLDWCDFTSDMRGFKDWVGKLRADGGGDAAEDVFSGLEQAAKLSWTKGDGAKLVFIIADAPCHGLSFHDGVYDEHPGGDKHRRSAVTLLCDLQALGIQTCNFSHLNSSTKKMVRVFRLMIGDYGESEDPWITEDEMGQGDTSHLRERVFCAVSTSLSKSIAATFAAQDPHKAVKKERIELDTTPIGRIRWGDVTTFTGRRIKHLLPESMSSLLKAISDKEELLPSYDKVTYKICARPFDDGGATRLPFHAFKVGGLGSPSERNYVAKVFRSGKKEDHLLSKYKQQAEIQAVAAFMAIQFNKAGKDAGIRNIPDIKYIMATTFSAATDGAKESNFNMERWLEGGQIIKFNSNFGFVNHKAYGDLVQAFSHWTWHASKKKLMVVDAQGVWDEGRKQYTLFDPCVHCVDICRFQASTFTNMGEKGFDKFFLSHRCNDFCKCLGLPKHRMQF
ncbi:kinase-like domain-containing protein [Dunaliella salina]|uniref:Kinase-like domain-containing protein n=1 Tax=Dunaliella salina TaxID=3046 RepID=A0ABQ7GPW0_DUNSA|nr:kinase-like domain-containing protein [Dunaliella salina]|eukprot:KAF5836649.1 kinase-like domain-containing protein [Dunaliella salina]